MSQVIRLAHLSDLHLPFGLPRPHQWLGKRGLSGLSWLKKRRFLHKKAVAELLRDDMLAARPDLIALTGDLVNFGTSHEFKQSRVWLEGLGDQDRLVLIPGNHEAMAGRWSHHMVKHWGSCLSLENGNQPAIRRLEHIAVISLSTAIATPPFFAAGEIGRDQMDKAAGFIRQAVGEGLCPIVVMHHPPAGRITYRRGLKNHREVAKMFADCGASLVLHGHNHRAELSWISGPAGNIPVLGTPSFSMNPDSDYDAGAWRMITIMQTERGWQAEISERYISQEMKIATRTPIILTLPDNRACDTAVTR